MPTLKKILPEKPRAFNTKRKKRDKRFYVYKVEDGQKVHVADVYAEDIEKGLKEAERFFSHNGDQFFEMEITQKKIPKSEL